MLSWTVVQWLWLCGLLNAFNLETHSTSGQVRFRHVARVSYDGTHFKGFQTQDNVRTVQQEINTCLSKRFNRPMRITGASRTDSGVHARGQAIHFDLFNNEAGIDDYKKLQKILNRLLPDDIAIHNITAAPAGTAEQVSEGRLFHATASATGKMYHYRYCINDFVDPIQHSYCSLFSLPADWALFADCMQLFVGTHDFSAFANRMIRNNNERGADQDPMRTIYSIKHVDEGGGYFRMEMHVKSALYKMLRNIVGGAYAVARGAMPMDNLQEMLAGAASRTINPAIPAPPEGLLLEHVYYDHY